VTAYKKLDKAKPLRATRLTLSSENSD